MRAKRGKSSIILVFVIAIGAAIGVSACVIRARAHPTVAPPPPRYVEVDYRPGYVWMQGRWVWTSAGWQWRTGYWVRERPGYYYAPGYWDNRGGSYVWVSGSWRTGRAPRGVYRRNHRRSVRGTGGVWKRDHRRPTRTSKPRKGGTGGVWKRDHRDKKKKKKSKPHIRRRDHRR